MVSVSANKNASLTALRFLCRTPSSLGRLLTYLVCLGFLKWNMDRFQEGFSFRGSACVSAYARPVKAVFALHSLLGLYVVALNIKRESQRVSRSSTKTGISKADGNPPRPDRT